MKSPATFLPLFLFVWSPWDYEFESWSQVDHLQLFVHPSEQMCHEEHIGIPKAEALLEQSQDKCHYEETPLCSIPIRILKKKFSWNWNSRKNPISFLQIGFFPWHQSGSWFMKIFRNIIFTEKFLYLCWYEIGFFHEFQFHGKNLKFHTSTLADCLLNTLWHVLSLIFRGTLTEWLYSVMLALVSLTTTLLSLKGVSLG